MPTPSATISVIDRGEEICQVCHCRGEGCDGTVCHGFDAD
jgi:hypothetical protein